MLEGGAPIVALDTTLLVVECSSDQLPKFAIRFNQILYVPRCERGCFPQSPDQCACSWVGHHELGIYRFSIRSRDPHGFQRGLETFRSWGDESVDSASMGCKRVILEDL